MRPTNQVTKLLILAGFGIVLLACSGTPTHNSSTFPYEINQERLDNKPIKTVVIPHVNLGGLSRNYLEKEAPRIDSYVSAYLKENPLYVGWNSHALYECVHTHTSTKTNKVVWYC